MGPLFGPPHQRSPLHNQGALYRIRGTVFALLHLVGFSRHRDVQAPQTTGGISPLIRRVLPHSPYKHPPHQPVIARKTRRIIVRTDRSRAVARMWAAERDCEPRINTVSSGADHVGPEALVRINDCGPGRVFYCEPRVQLVGAATYSYRVNVRRHGMTAPPRPYLAYSNVGNAFSASLVAPGSISLPPSILSCPAGMATSFRSSPKKPPTPRMT
jgi:hypothetical protein